MISVLHDRVLISVDDIKEDEVSASGIIIPDGAKDKSGNKIGIVVSVGPDVKGIKAGDKVMLTQYGYDEVEVEKKQYIITKIDNILAVYE